MDHNYEDERFPENLPFDEDVPWENETAAGPGDVPAASGDPEDGQGAKEGPSLDESFKRLDEIAARIEEKDVSLEESFRLYQEGMNLLKYCSGKIDQVEKKMMEISADGTLKEF
ncbi:MAG: exodeoxyribonuclease VII small subunit [Bilifractor sp.]|jgi:exodeoxyribonuclease VII small subunit